ncbi:MAG: hypothetical protein J1F35_01720 [Erysipelotrichales bacterium]|nr:hypothetical protein [Erysipelotrichales bacterium]
MTERTKKDLTYVAIAISVGLAWQGFTWHMDYKQDQKNSEFKYYKLADGTYQANEEVKHSAAVKWVLVERINQEGNKELCIANRDGINVLTNEFVGEINFAGETPFSQDESILSVVNIEPYIEQFGTKEYYSAQYFEALIDAILESYEWHKEKVLEIKIPENTTF